MGGQRKWWQVGKGKGGEVGVKAERLARQEQGKTTDSCDGYPMIFFYHPDLMPLLLTVWGLSV